MKLDQDLCSNLMASRSYFGKMNSILGSVVPLAMFDKPSSLKELKIIARIAKAASQKLPEKITSQCP